MIDYEQLWKEKNLMPCHYQNPFGHRHPSTKTEKNTQSRKIV